MVYLASACRSMTDKELTGCAEQELKGENDAGNSNRIGPNCMEEGLPQSVSWSRQDGEVV